MINRAILVGRLTKDPNFMENQVAVANFTVAVNRTFKNKNGEQETDFINVVTFRKQAENVNNYLSKGSLVGIDGRIQTRNYENKDGQRIFVTEVVADSVQFLEPKGQSNNQSLERRGQAKPQQAQAKDNPFANGAADISESELPF
ncbi:single-stranded DNA-binding protein [Staphylococcus nepalensis]